MAALLEKKLGLATRDAYGETLAELGKRHPKIVVLDGDLSKSTKTAYFAKAFPDRFFNFGIGEANILGAASGLAAAGLIPVCSSFACFITCKGYDQLRIAIAYSNVNVKIVASHGGISVGEDGVSQQSIEDLALAASLPNFTVIHPADEWATRALVTQAVIEHEGPVYMRTGRPKTPLIYNEGSRFELGKDVKLREGKDAAIIAVGMLVWEALAAHELLKEKGIHTSVIDMHTLKPIDEETLVREAASSGAVVTCEEHTIYGGLGSIVAGTLAKRHPVPQEFVAIQDTYAESGKQEELFEKYALTANHIVKAVERAVKRKK